MGNSYLDGLVQKNVRILRTGGARPISGILKRVEDQGVVIVYQIQERVPSGEPISTGRMIDQEAFVPFETIDRIVSM